MDYYNHRSTPTPSPKAGNPVTNAPRPHERRLFDAEFASVSEYHGTAAPVRVSSSVVVVGSPPGGPLATMCWTHTIAPSSIIVQLSLTTKVLSPSPVFVAVAVYGKTGRAKLMPSVAVDMGFTVTGAISSVWLNAYNVTAAPAALWARAGEMSVREGRE
ncbi:hypothetical protein FA13DRAFT_1721839 [Coprinellus micaceus]|uniref:Uncharacterized protein n=1 Tax=Coprinellus micaceus TaxID=71717 RepID=A0A4Y7RWJ3_COPMI|nr:hypothetical protein FA13DRAFT_1721839 [Coprinellus micaceus]